MKNFVNADFVFVNKGRIEIITEELDPEEASPFRTPIDKDDLNGRIDEMIDIISNKLEFLEFRYEQDALKFFGGYIINYALLVEVVTYLGFTLYSIYQEVIAKWDSDASGIAKEKERLELLAAAQGKLWLQIL